MIGGHDAGEHGVVRAFDARHVHKARRATNQRAAGEDEFWHALPSAFCDRARAEGDPLGPF